ncbi:MAG: DUF4384 domain-containing protein, partial [Deltaproteobacteria bacterium]|nr:DUF4384 domain-containing protein [Deltaproteobacteria bacterium]
MLTTEVRYHALDEPVNARNARFSTREQVHKDGASQRLPTRPDRCNAFVVRQGFGGLAPCGAASLMVALTAVCVSHSRAIPARSTQAAPDEEKRSSIHEVDGFAQLSENETLAQTRANAFASAKRQALEAARTFVRSKTAVKDFQVEYDVVQAASEGEVAVLEQKDFGVENNSRYHVWVRAEVTYTLRSRRPAVVASTAGPEETDVLLDSDSPLTVRVWTEKKSYQTAELVKVFIVGNKDFNARLVDIQPDGTILQLLPNDHRRDSRFKAGRVYEIPGEGDGFKLEVNPPYGEDRIEVFASDATIGVVGTEPVVGSGGLRRVSSTAEEMSKSIRGLRIAPTTAGSAAGEFYEASWSYRTAA